MFGLFSTILTPMLSFAFGTKKKAAYSMMFIGALGLAGATWYLTDKYSDMKVRVAEMQSTLISYEQANEQLSINLGQLQAELDKKDSAYQTAILKRRTLESEIQATETKRRKDLEVFDKECGRIDRLMQKKASLVVRLANRATSKLRDKFAEATNNN